MTQSESTSSIWQSAKHLRTAFAAILVLTLLSGVVHGYLDGRWAQREDLVQVGVLLEELPSQMGPWKLLERQQISEGALQLLRCYGSTNRIYEHQKTGQRVNMAVLFGPRGPIAVHTPEVCYDSVGTKQSGATRKETIRLADSTHDFWSVRFRRGSDPDPSLEVWYGWSDGGRWIAAEHPRFWLTENLYKIQVAGPVGEGTNRPCESFVTELVPHLRPLLR